MSSKCQDPLEALPFEVAKVIFEQLRTHDLVICLSVSKSWKNLLESMTNLWTTIITTDKCQPITLKVLRSYLRVSSYSVNRALVGIKFFEDESNVRHLMETCHQLQDVRISGEDQFTISHAASLAKSSGIKKLYFSPKTIIDVPTMISSLEACQKTIEEAEFLCLIEKRSPSKFPWPKMSALRSIHLHFRQRCELELSGLIEATPNIRSFMIYRAYIRDKLRLDMTQWPNLETLDLKKTKLRIFPKLPSSLKHLTLEKNYGLTFRSNDDNGNYSLPLLETFTIQDNKVEVSTIWEITKSCIQANKLKALICGRLSPATPTKADPHEYFPPSSTLEELSLEGFRIGNSEILTIARLYPRLKKINVSQTFISLVGFQELVEIGMKSINIDGSLEVHPRYVEEAEKKGVEVSMKAMNNHYWMGNRIIKLVPG
ncbi:Bgt-3426 [Blumeria graminis f. sp. tritici]|uniref:Bgt-3426 n=2 Tax=Blumeria graminis f. sp. tritici TaxID=62690 RepID=A0A9X9LBU6_BLUGR|nr:hypothetical protein BGT96224_3426 [Blumeria graminis f. sp. tritici 96224]VCU41257.1 Bgt-3426 [Blumeria graminis f. sp. tritici]